MTIVVLPFNAASGANHSLARQFANYACDLVRAHTKAEINAVNVMARYEDEGVPRFAVVNPSESLNEAEVLQQFFQQGGFEFLVDGLLEMDDERSGRLVVRYWKTIDEPDMVQTLPFVGGSLFDALRVYIEELVERVGGSLPEEAEETVGLFGTESEEAFLKFLEGYDMLQYVERAQGQVAKDFNPTVGLDLLNAALDEDPDWEGPYLALIQYCRTLAGYRLGDARAIEKTLQAATVREPTDARAWFALGELYEAMGNAGRSADMYEKAHTLQPEEPAILTRLGLAQMAAGMPVNAERNFRKAMEMEGEDKPSLDYLANVLAQTGRAHEVPDLWKEMVAKYPQSANFRAKHAIALVQAGKREEAERAFDVALETLDDNLLVKRWYAPYLRDKGELDRAMDLYEDCLDASPTDGPCLLEYAQTLQAAGREFEVPKVLRDVLATNPDANNRAQVNAWLIELEQAKRVESVQAAAEKLEQGDAQGALDAVKPLRNWLADYWKLWMLVASAHNRLNQWDEAEQAAMKLLELFPACEPGYGELLNALTGQGRHEEAFNHLRGAMVSTGGGSPTLAILYALACQRSGRVDEARQLTKQLREAFGPNNPQLEAALTEIG